MQLPLLYSYEARYHVLGNGQALEDSTQGRFIQRTLGIFR